MTVSIYIFIQIMYITYVYGRLIYIHTETERERASVWHNYIDSLPNTS